MIKNIKFWLECSRYYALPMTIFSWGIVFVYSVKLGGNILYGLIALLGICCAHLATNLFDDYCDYNNLKKVYDGQKTILPNTQRGKCKYILNGSTSTKEVLTVVFIYCLIALIIGGYFYSLYGYPILLFVGTGAFIVLMYSFCSNHALSELFVGTAFGPLLFAGTYYVMTGVFSIESVILSVPSSIFTVNLLYTDTFLDKDIDKNEEKKTLVNLLGSDIKALYFQKGLLILGYLSLFLLPIFKICGWFILFGFITIPYAVDLIQSLYIYAKEPARVPQKKWYHFPFEYWEDIEENRSPVFMFRMYQARNLMIYTSTIITISILF